MGLREDLRKLREDMRAGRSALSAKQRLLAADACFESIQKLPMLASAGRIAGYWAVAGEMPLHPLVGALQVGKGQYYLPVLRGKQLVFAPWRVGEPLAPNKFGIPEPDRPKTVEAAELQIIFMPLLAFDRRGNRLGQGAGYYDRTLAFVKPLPRPASPLLVGVAYAFQETEKLPAQSWDVPLDYIATEKALIAV